MRCETCDVELGSLALVEQAGAELPEGTSGVATLTSALCVGCWDKLGKHPSCVLYRGRVLTMEDIAPLDMRPIDLERAVAAGKVALDEEAARAEALKTKLNRLAILTFHDPFREESVVVHRDEWVDPIEIAVSLVAMVRELRSLGREDVDEILNRAGVVFSSSPEEPTE